jgi:hypothetical protein
MTMEYHDVLILLQRMERVEALLLELVQQGARAEEREANPLITVVQQPQEIGE